MTERGFEITLQLDWGDINSSVPKPVNAYLTVLAPPAGGEPDGIILALGHTMPPILTGSPQENGAYLEAMGSLPVMNHGTFLLSRARAVELVQQLQESIQHHDDNQTRRTEVTP